MQRTGARTSNFIRVVRNDRSGVRKRKPGPRNKSRPITDASREIFDQS